MILFRLKDSLSGAFLFGHFTFLNDYWDGWVGFRIFG